MRSVFKLIGIAALLIAGFIVVPGVAQSRPPAGQTPTTQPGRRERHPHMRAALRELRAAHKQLGESAHDYGGHRVAALASVDEAIKQIEDGLAYDVQHEQTGGTPPTPH